MRGRYLQAAVDRAVTAVDDGSQYRLLKLPANSDIMTECRQCGRYFAAFINDNILLFLYQLLTLILRLPQCSSKVSLAQERGLKDPVGLSIYNGLQIALYTSKSGWPYLP
jgi:hypothetical protein